MSCGEICWFFCGVNLKEVLCQLPACVLSSLLPTPPCSALYFSKLHFPGSIDSGLHLSLVTEKYWPEVEGPEQGKGKVPFCLLSLESIVATSCVSPLCLQQLPDVSSETSASIWWSWILGSGNPCSFQPREGRG